jgi:hypothetical protein
MMAHGFGEKDIHLVGVILVTKGHYALDMRGIASMGRPGPGREKYHQDDRGSNDGVTKKKTKKEDCRERRLDGRSGSSRCRRSSARVTQLAAQALKKIATRRGTKKMLSCASCTGWCGSFFFEMVSAGHNGPGATGRQAQKTENNKGENTGAGTPRADMAQTARYSHVAPLLGGRHKNGQNYGMYTGG